MGTLRVFFFLSYRPPYDARSGEAVLRVEVKVGTPQLRDGVDPPPCALDSTSASSSNGIGVWRARRSSLRPLPSALDGFQERTEALVVGERANGSCSFLISSPRIGNSVR
jgi:hypothetical protein